MAMGFVDVAVVGRLGAVPLAAVGLGNGIFFTLSVVGLGVMMGLDPLVAQALGANDQLRARRLLWQGIWLGVGTGLVIAVPVALIPAFLERFGIASDVASETRAYVWVRLASLIPMLVFTAMRSYLQANRITWPLVMAVVVANVANYFLDVWFVFGGAGLPAMGAAGAALSTLICTVLQIGFLVFAVARIRVVGFDASGRGPQPAQMRHALRVGAPIGLQLGAEVGVFALAGLIAARMGAEAAAAHQVALTLASVSFCVAVGVASAGAVRVGHLVGAMDTPGARRSGLLAFVAGGTVMGSSALLFLLAPDWLAGTLTDKPEILVTAVPLLAVAAAFQVSDGLQAVGAGVLRGAGDTRFAFVANLAGHYLVGLPVALIASFVFDEGVRGLWYGLAAGLTAVAVALLIRFLQLSSRPIRAISSDAPPIASLEPVVSSAGAPISPG